MGFCRSLAIVDDRDCSDSEVAIPSGRKKTGTGGEDSEETAQKKTPELKLPIERYRWIPTPDRMKWMENGGMFFLSSRNYPVSSVSRGTEAVRADDAGYPTKGSMR